MTIWAPSSRFLIALRGFNHKNMPVYVSLFQTFVSTEEFGYVGYVITVYYDVLLWPWWFLSMSKLHHLCPTGTGLEGSCIRDWISGKGILLVIYVCSYALSETLYNLCNCIIWPCISPPCVFHHNLICNSYLESVV